MVGRVKVRSVQRARVWRVSRARVRAAGPPLLFAILRDTLITHISSRRPPLRDRLATDGAHVDALRTRLAEDQVPARLELDARRRVEAYDALGGLARWRLLAAYHALERRPDL